jgi:hypothetical protein
MARPLPTTAAPCLRLPTCDGSALGIDRHVANISDFLWSVICADVGGAWAKVDFSRTAFAERAGVFILC